MITAFLGLGCNLGDRPVYLAQALAMLESAECQIATLSPLYESPALLAPDAPAEWNLPYLNAVAQVHTRHEPAVLLELVKAIEQALGRQDRGHWAPREMDIDILDYDSSVVATERLAVPHPQLHLRDFVLLPWRDIAPDWCHPLLGLTIEQLADALPHTTARRYVA